MNDLYCTNKACTLRHNCIRAQEPDVFAMYIKFQAKKEKGKPRIDKECTHYEQGALNIHNMGGVVYTPH